MYRSCKLLSHGPQLKLLPRSSIVRISPARERFPIRTYTTTKYLGTPPNGSQRVKPLDSISPQRYEDGGKQRETGKTMQRTSGFLGWGWENWSFALISTAFVVVVQQLLVFQTGGSEESPFSILTWPLLRSSVIPPTLSPGNREPLDPDEFKRFILVEKDPISSNGSVLTLQTNKPSQWHGEADPYADFWAKGVWSVEIKQPQLQISRRYTPLPPLMPSTVPHWESVEKGLLPPWQKDIQRNLRLFIRREFSGEVSNYLNDLPLDTRVEIRGGYTEFELPRNVEEVVFLAGGTGIAPAIQLAHCLQLRSKVDQVTSSRMRVLWANRRRDECEGVGNHEKSASISQTSKSLNSTVLALQLQRFCSSSSGLQFTIDSFVDAEGTYIREEEVSNALTISKTSQNSEGSHGKKLILISGPDGFVEYLAGPRSYQRGREFRGLSGGILSKIDLHGWEVHKL